MLLEREIKQFIKAHHLYNLVKIIPPSLDASVKRLSLNIALDLTKTIRQNQQIGLFIIGNYYKFVQIFQESVKQEMLSQNLCVPQNGVNINFHLSNCPLMRHNFESVEFLSAAFEQKEGVLVYMMDSYVTHVYESQFYLQSWQETWRTNCKCNQYKVDIKNRQKLIDIIKTQSKDIKSPISLQPPRCNQCSSKMILQGIRDQNFVDCQKISVLMSVDNCQSNLLTSQDVFHKGQFNIYLDENYIGKFFKGDIIDMCCYYTACPQLLRIDGKKMIIKPKWSFYMVSHYPSNSISSKNGNFLANLSCLEMQYIRCRDPQDLQTICYNYKKLLKTINLMNFPYLGQNNLSTLKLLLVNSVFNHFNRVNMHIFALTDEVALYQKIFHLQGLTIKSWPSLYDQITLKKFITTCHQAFIIITNPNKKDWQSVQMILNSEEYSMLNFTLWIISQPIKNMKKQINLDKIPIVIDLTSQKNMHVCRPIYDIMVEERLSMFIKGQDIMHTAQKGKKIEENNEYEYDGAFQGIQSNEEEENQQSKVAQRLLQTYFVKAREYKNIGQSSLRNIQNIAQGFSSFRYFLRSKGKLMRPQQYINVLDAVLAIFIQEQTSRHKIGPSNTLFSNEISKLLLNEGDCELSFWELEVDENQEIGERKRMLKKEDMFKRMVQKLTRLLYSGEVY